MIDRSKIPGGELYAVRADWLALHSEPIIEPDLPIIDTHHHLREGAGQRYLFDEVLDDVSSGHNVVATVFMQSGSKSRGMYRADGEAALAPVGETEYVNGVAAMSASGNYGPCRLCAGIIGTADLTLGDRIKPVLEAHIRAGGDRFRGIRFPLAWDGWQGITSAADQGRGANLESPELRTATAHFAPLGMIFEAWVYYTQMDAMIRLARDFPDTAFVLNHLGGPLHIGPYADDRQARFDAWRKAVLAAAELPNMTCKIGGIGMHYGGFEFHKRDKPASSQEIADAWRPYVETCVEAFGAERCMAESNFPVDKAIASYAVMFNALKRTTSGASADEKAAIYAGTAKRVYRLAV